LGPDPGSQDEELLKAFLEGDESAFTTLMRRYENRIFSLALRMTRDRTDALDATQDAFISAFRRAGSFRGEAAFSTWLYRIGINSCNDLLRKKARLPVPTEEETTDRGGLAVPGPSLEDKVGTKLELAQALASLPPEYLEAVVMHDLGGVPYEEIARAMGIAIGTVKSRISRGRRKLALSLEQAQVTGTSKGNDGSSD
jgi:RNA polymerase sigma-70 factor (ECF subfamily)